VFLGSHHGSASAQCEWLPDMPLDLQTLIHYYSLAIICLQETHWHPFHALNLHSYMAHQYDHPHNMRASGEMAIILKDCIYCVLINLSSPLQVTAVHLHQLNVCFTLCNIYVPPAVPLSPADLTSWISHLKQPFILLGNFNARNILWVQSLLTEGEY
jgi:hypothetical protein